MKRLILNRMREPSTWRGLIWIATVLGFTLRPDQADAIIAAGMALAGAIGAFFPDHLNSYKSSDE